MINCKPNNQTAEICSGHGKCECGVCECDARPNPQELFYGTYCECDNFSCKRSDGQVCLKTKQYNDAIAKYVHGKNNFAELLENLANLKIILLHYKNNYLAQA
jgi:hypothetical protein